MKKKWNLSQNLHSQVKSINDFISSILIQF